MAEPQQQPQRREKPETTTNMDDFISGLPDALLCHILSFLPIIDSVATAVLSRRWRHLWKDLLVLEFSEDPFHLRSHSDEDEARIYFAAFVDAVLSQRSSVYPTKFSLFTYLDDRNTVTNWIRAAIGPHLQELHLYLYSCHEVFRFTSSVFNCNSLVSLTLDGMIYLNHLSTVQLPSLKTLYLDVPTVNPIGMLLRGSPLLETLHLSFNVKEIRPVSIFKDHETSCVIDDLEIDKPSLKHLYIDMYNFDCVPEWRLRLSVSDFPNIVDAIIRVHPNSLHVAWVPKLLMALREARSLVLRAETTECLLRATAMEIPNFSRLLRLRVHLPLFCSGPLIELLRNCHMLQLLSTCNHKGKWFGEWCRHTTQPKGWTRPTNVPACVRSHLNILDCQKYGDSDEERAFTEYILRSGLVLETVAIHTGGCYQEGEDVVEKLYQELSIVPRGSDICQLEID